MFLRFKTFTLFTLMFLAVSIAFAQEKTDKEKTSEKQTAEANKNFTAEQIVESAIFIYGYPGGRATLNQIRKTTFERGKITQVNLEGKTEKSNFERYVLRGESLDKEKIRLEQEFPNGRFGLIYNDDKIIGVYNDTIFPPREDVSNSFQNQIWHGLEALLRYKENGATITLDGKEKVLGVEFYRIDVADKQNRKTRFFISAKSFRVMMLEYTESSVKYVRRFYNYNYAQGTLVAYRTVLWAGDKQTEETETSTISFGLRIEDNTFVVNN